MLKFIVLRAKSACSFEKIKQNLVHFGLHTSSVWPDVVGCRLFPESNALELTFENTTSAGFPKRHVLTAGPAHLLFDGLPYFDEVDAGDYSASVLKKFMSKKDEDALLDEMHGGWSMCWVTDKGAYALSDFSGMCPLYTIETDEFAAVSNRQFLIGVARDGGSIALDPLGASWLTGQGSHMGGDMLVSGVKHVLGGSSVRLKFGAPQPRVTVRPPVMSTPASQLDDNLSDAEAAEFVDRIVRQMNALARMPIGPLRLDITGGMDSRCVVALALSTDLRNKVDTLQTGGPPGSREVEVGAKLAAMVGVPHEARTHLPGVYAFDSILHRVRAQMFRYEGMICPTDAYSAPQVGSRVSVAGSAGELYRRHCKPHMNIHLKTPGDVFRTYASYQGRNDPLDVQRRDISALQREVLRTEAFALLDEGACPNDISDIFFRKFRMTHWNGVIRCNIRAAVRLSPLANSWATRLAFRKIYRLRTSDRYHFEILARLRRDLAEAPFLDNKWSPHVQEIAAARGLSVAQEPIATATRKTVREIIPIGFAFVHNHREAFRSYVLDRWTDKADSIFDRAKVEERLKDGAPWSGGITSIKAACSLASITGLLAGDYVHEVEGDTSRPPRLEGDAEALLASQAIDYASVASSRLSFSLSD